MTKRLIGLCTGLLFVTACGGGDSGEMAQTSSDGAASGRPDVNLFERIDADTAYVMANLDTVPEDMTEILWQPLEDMAEFQSDGYDEVAAEVDEQSPVAAALAREFGQINGPDDLEERGLAANGYWAIHSISLYPVLHWQLVDAAAFDAMLERVATEAESELPRRAIDDQEVVWIELDGLGLAIHHDQHVLTVAMIPDNDLLLRRVANLVQPATAYDPASLQAFNEANGFTPHGSGYIDLKRMVDHLLDVDDELTAPVRAAAEMDSMAGNPACRREMDALTDRMPRMSAGLTRLDREEVTVLGRIETEAGLGEQLAGLSDTPVTVETRQPALLAAGAALNIVAARDFARELVDGWVAQPPECPAFASIRANAAEWQASLNRPIPPFVTNIHGFRVDLENLAMDASGSINDASGTLAVFMRNPQMLIGMAQMFSPELAEIQLTPGGEPQPLPTGLVPNMPELEAWMALGDAAIGMAVGQSQRDDLPAALEGGESESAIFAYSLNMAAYGELMESMMSNLDAGDEVPSFDFMTQLGDHYVDSRFAIRLTPAGIDFVTSSALKQ
jgi:oligoribonuclease (3'-5' exoribonuclease)